YTDEVSKAEAATLSEALEIIESLKAELAKAQNLVDTDELTQIPNRRAFFNKAPEAIEAARKRGIDITLLMIDLDHFKKVNDDFGHSVGDGVLKAFGSALKEALREKTDIFSRYGGEEFIVILPGTTAEHAHGVASKLDEAFAEELKRDPKIPDHITISVGAAFIHNSEPLRSAIDRADRYLYDAKEGGRNGVCVEGEFQKLDRESK
ncbi:GGDEF domain-containing protein, partial [bacterium]|nr:GGDEF domain-containing protein [bacterium]